MPSAPGNTTPATDPMRIAIRPALILITNIPATTIHITTMRTIIPITMDQT